MKRSIILNTFFILLTGICLLLSIFFWFFLLIPFLFLPVICFLPFVKKKKNDDESLIDFHNSSQQIEGIKDGTKIRSCHDCGGEIKEPIAKFCYHCSSKLNNK